MKKYKLSIRSNDYVIVDKNDDIYHNELNEQLTTIKSCFDFLENNSESYSSLHYIEFEEQIIADCIENILKEKYGEENIELLKPDIKTIDTKIEL